MCAICGIVNFSNEDPVDANTIERMTAAMAHRGPDDDGFFVNGNVGLGHRRLSIIDLSGGKQPIFNEDGSAVIIFNGEVYNYAALTSELISKGHVFRTRCDTEAILHCYEEYGEDCVQHLRGMFAFAIWDARKRSLFVARDRLGIKPLYYYRDQHKFAFASEIKALLELPGMPREIDPESLDLYLSLRYVPAPRTMFKHIFKLQPGHTITVSESGLRMRKYWDLEYGSVLRRSPSDYIEELRHLLFESVKMRLMAEVPLGVFLSGGLDSSAILAVMSKITGGSRIKTFSVGYETASAEEEKSNEFFYARLAARMFSSDHHEFRVNASDFGNFIPELVWHLDEPLADPSCIPLYFISKLARRHITVVLSGEGADETLAGYGIYRRMLMLERAHRALGAVSGFLAPSLAAVMPGESGRCYLRMAGVPLDQRYTGVSRAFRPELKSQLIAGFNAAESADRLREVFQPYFQSTRMCSPLDRMLCADTKVWLPDDILLKADKMTMANSLELRVPFLDHRFVEFAAGLPPDFKLNGQWGKFPLRQAMQDVLPRAILRRSKKGFPVPTAQWLRAPLRGLTREALLSSDSACRNYLNAPVLESIVADNENGTAKRDQEIWTLLVFEIWHRLFLDRRLERGSAKTQLAEVA